MRAMAKLKPAFDTRDALNHAGKIFPQGSAINSVYPDWSGSSDGRRGLCVKGVADSESNSCGDAGPRGLLRVNCRWICLRAITRPQN